MKFSGLLVLTQLSALSSAGVGNQEINQLKQAQDQQRANQAVGVNNYPPYPPPSTTTTTKNIYPPHPTTTTTTTKATTTTTTTNNVYPPPPVTTTTTTTTNNVYPPPSTTTTTTTTTTNPPLTPDECNKKPALINLCVIAGILKPNPTVCGGASDKTLIDICIVAGILAPTPGACNNRPSPALISLCVEAGILPGTQPSPTIIVPVPTSQPSIDCSKKENIAECIKKGYLKNPTKQQCTLGGVLTLCLNLGLLIL